MKNIKFIIVNIFIIIHMVFIFAYAADIKDTPASVPPVPDVPAPVQPQIQQQAQANKASDSNYKYYPLGKPDPFKPFIDIEINIKKKDERKFSDYPLERAEIERFRLAGIMGDAMQRLAIVEIMEEGRLRFYPLMRGTHIGLHKGKVMEIMADRVIVEEPDKSKTRRIILKLHKENEVNP
jgi:Tfp pilus assembly protein PilP